MSTSDSSPFARSSGGVVVDLAAWLAGRVSYAEWSRLVARPPPAEPAEPAEPTEPAPQKLQPPRDEYLATKYLAKWRQKVIYLT